MRLHWRFAPRFFNKKAFMAISAISVFLLLPVVLHLIDGRGYANFGGNVPTFYSTGNEKEREEYRWHNLPAVSSQNATWHEPGPFPRSNQHGAPPYHDATAMPYYSTLQENIEQVQQSPLNDLNCNPIRSDRINIHIVAHSHDDVGWLKSVDEYYWGTKYYIQPASVQLTIDTVLSELARQPDRRFVFVEMAFFWRWWKLQNDRTKELARKLLRTGQFEIATGGWSMADEANVDYESLIDQHTHGFDFIMNNLDSRYGVKVGWQIDPFGHSREVGSIFRSMGMNSFMFQRYDYQDQFKRNEMRQAEMVWKTSPVNNPSAQLFVSTLARNSYGPPDSFNWDALRSPDESPPIVTDPESPEYNVPERVETFLQFMEEQAKIYATPNLMVTMGMDFYFTNANPWFVNIERLIEGINNRSSKYWAVYSTPSCYTKAVYDSKPVMTIKSDDFFPYAQRAHSYWTGYFTSRPALKFITRQLGSLSNAARTFDLIAGHIRGANSELIEMFDKQVSYINDAVGILQHHDAITGTAKQAVTDDYVLRATLAIKFSTEILAKATSSILGLAPSMRLEDDCILTLNVSSCHRVDSASQFAVTLVNRLSRPVVEIVRIPVMAAQADLDFEVTDHQGTPIRPLNLVPIDNSVLALPDRPKISQSTHELVFQATVPAFGASVYFVTRVQAHGSPHIPNMMVKAGSSGKQNNQSHFRTPYGRKKRFHHDRPTPSADLPPHIAIPTLPQASAPSFNDVQTIENQYYKLTIQSDGLFSSLQNLQEGVTTNFNQLLGYYVGKTGGNWDGEEQASGAYIFRPNGQSYMPFVSRPYTVIRRGDGYAEVSQTYQDNIAQIWRLYDNRPWVDVQWIVGGLKNSYGSLEVVAVYKTGIHSNGTFYTDANGREWLTRQRDHRDTWDFQNTEPVSGNYYPVNQRIAIKDDSAVFTVLVDRAEGGTGYLNGEVELMLHRETSNDDALGVGEPLQERGPDGKPLIVTGHHRIMLTRPFSAAKHYRPMSVEMRHPSAVFVTPDASLATWIGQKTFSALSTSTSIPENLHVVTALRLHVTRCPLMLRIEHIYEKGEDPELSMDATINLHNLATDLLSRSSATPRRVVEMALGADRPLGDAFAIDWMSHTYTPLKTRNAEDTRAISLEPMQMRTFCVFI